MSDPTQNPPPDDSGQNPPPPPPGAGQGGYPPPPPPPGQGGYNPPPPGGGDYGTGAPPPPPPPGGWQQPGSMPPPVQGYNTGIGQPAELLPRFLARLIDFILVGIVNGVLVSVFVIGSLMDGDVDSFGTWGMNNGSAWAAGAVSSILSTAITLGYFTFMEHNRGQTVGKMLLKLETRGPDGGRPTMEQAVKRNAFTAIGLLGIIPVIGLISGLLSLVAVIMIAVTINNNSVTRRGWHDDFAGGTQVVKVG